jgi:transposase
MNQKRRTFDGNFKFQVVHMIKEQGLSISQDCLDMSLGATAVRRWLKTGRGRTNRRKFTIGKALAADQRAFTNWKLKFVSYGEITVV